MSTLKFGIELECTTAWSHDEMRHQLARAGMAAWDVKFDGSIRGTGTATELVSPILSMGDVRAMVPVVCETLRAARAMVNTSCGFHVHVSGLQSVEARMVRNVARRFVNFEDTLDLLQPVERRANNAAYARSNARLFGATPVEATQRLWAICHDHGGQANLNVSRDSLISLFSPNSRYFKVNLHSLHRHGTVEFRHHSGAVTTPDVLHWVEFLNAFTTVAMEQQRLWKRPATTPESTADRVRKMTRGMAPATVAHVWNRIRAMA